ncbi:MAG: dinitrogenase iron-molybdenum cofactor biosynthesis protein [Anaerofustis stercorihominis]|nr:dinitrogenase iron-molybdenum cofactor biosynthesis protein [Anaerofustis stercorihominis]
MKIAVTYENGQIFQHFGHTEQFKVYTVENKEVVAMEVIDTNGSGHGALAGLLADINADILICGGIGGGAQRALSQAGVTLYAGNSGLADVAVSKLIGGTLEQIADANCGHDHGEDHDCDDHDCGDHDCGEEKCH